MKASELMKPTTDAPAPVKPEWPVTSRHHGVTRSRYKGTEGMRRFVGLGVIADNLVNIGRAMAK